MLPDVLLINVPKFEFPTNSTSEDEFLTVNSELYRLCGALDHLGNDQYSGHWITWSRCRHAEKNWMLCDDTLIKSTSIKEVFNKNNYVLAYEKCFEYNAVESATPTYDLSKEVANILQSY